MKTALIAAAALVLISQSALGDSKKSCPAALKTFPFLKPWAQKLENFSTPTTTGNTSDSLLYAIGATLVKKGAASRWMGDSFKQPVQSGRYETKVLGDYNNSSTDGLWNGFWTALLTPVERELLSQCKAGNCKIKFNDHELEAIGANETPKGRETLFRDIVGRRVTHYKTNGTLASYEGSTEFSAVEKVLLGREFPRELAKEFWFPKERKFFGFEVLDSQPGRHRPVTALFSRHCESRGQGKAAYTACSDLVIYNNHYFDFWGRIVLFFPWCDNELALAYESADVDQLKSSRVARMLFGGEMRQLFGLLLETRLRRLHMLGS